MRIFVWSVHFRRYIRPDPNFPLDQVARGPNRDQNQTSLTIYLYNSMLEALFLEKIWHYKNFRSEKGRAFGSQNMFNKLKPNGFLQLSFLPKLGMVSSWKVSKMSNRLISPCTELVPHSSLNSKWLSRYHRHLFIIELPGWPSRPPPRSTSLEMETDDDWYGKVHLCKKPVKTHPVQPRRKVRERDATDG